MKRYAEHMGNHVKQRTKSLCDNKLVDNEESMNMLVASQISETARTQVIPELDALNVRAA